MGRLMIAMTVMLSACADAFPASAHAQEARVTAASRAPFAKVADALERAITDQNLALVCHADAQRGAQARGASIKGNQVMMVFRNDYALRLIKADPAAAFEAPCGSTSTKTPTAPRP